MNIIGNRKQSIFFILQLSLTLMFFVQLSVFEIKIGLIVLAGLILLLTALIKPQYIFYLLVSLCSIEGFTALQNISYPKIVGILLIMGLVLKIAVTKESIPQDDSYIYFYIFLAGSLVSFAFSKDLSISVQTYITYISLFIFYVCARYFLRDIEEINRVLNYLFFSTLIVFAIFQVTGFSIKGHSRLSLGIGDPNEFASFILVLIPFALYRVMSSSGFWRFSYWVILICFLFLFIFTFSRGGVLGFLGIMVVFVFYYSIRRLKQILFFILILLAIAYFYIPDDFWFRISTITNPELESEIGESSIKVRIENYQAALRMFLDYPLAGVGLSNFRFNSKNYGTSNELVTHNTYLEILTGGGLLSFIPFSLILINCWKKIKIKKSYDEKIRNFLICLKASFVSILITSFFISGDHKKILWFSFAIISSSHYALKMKNCHIK